MNVYRSNLIHVIRTLSVLTQSAPIIAHAAMAFVETGLRAKMLMNARKEPTIAVGMLTVQIASELMTATVAMDFKKTVGHAKT